MSVAQAEPLWRRTLQHVRRDSPLAGGDWEDAWRTTLSHRELVNLGKDVRARDRETLALAKARGQKRGCSNGHLGGPLGKEIIELLANVAKKNQGRIECPLIWIARQIGCAYSTVSRKTAQLKLAGVLSWSRRSVEVDDEGEAPPRGRPARQTTNIYRLHLPHAVRDAHKRRPPTVPECALELRRQRDLQRQTWFSQEPSKVPGKGTLAEACAKLGGNTHVAARKRGDPSAGPIPGCPEIDFALWPT